MDQINKQRFRTYQIKFQGRLDKSWQKWFRGISLSTDRDIHGNTTTTLMAHIRDQAELRGILNKFWDLNLSLISVFLIENDMELE